MAKIIRMLIILVLIAIVGIAGFLAFQFFTKPALVVDVGEFNGEQLTCHDSDGVNLNKKGSIQIFNEDGEKLEILGEKLAKVYGGSTFEAVDTCCKDDPQCEGKGIVEHTCQTDGSIWFPEDFACPNGGDCENGRCV